MKKQEHVVKKVLEDSCAGRKDHRCGADSAWNV